MLEDEKCQHKKIIIKQMKGMRITRVGTAILNDSQLTCEPRLDESRGVSPANN